MHVNNSILYNKCEKMEVWQTQSDMIQNRTWKVLLHMGTSDEKIQIPVVRVYFKGENKTARCACALPKKTFHYAPGGRLKSYIPCTVTKTILSNITDLFSTLDSGSVLL